MSILSRSGTGCAGPSAACEQDHEGADEGWRLGTPPWIETAKEATSLQDKHVLSIVCLFSGMCCQLRSLHAESVQHIAGLICGVDVVDPGTWMMGRPDLARSSAAFMLWFRRRRPI